MKEWFGYEFGYVNIDDTAVYLNNTGNWSDIPALKEKTKKNGKGDKKKVLLLGYVLAFIAIFTGVIYGFNVLKYIGAGSVVLLIAVYKYMIKEVGIAIKIPKKKITKIVREDNVVNIQFVNGLGEPDELKLTNVDKKGIVLMGAVFNCR